MSKIAIIGAGFVGSTAAYALVLQGIAGEIALIDVNKQKAEGEALDLEHSMPYLKHTVFTFGDDYALCKNADIVVITAGFAQKQGETRLQLAARNATLFKEIVPKIVQYAPSTIILVVTNPVDILTALTIKYSGLPKERVFGTGTALDTARFRYLLGEAFHINPKSIHTFILGEHGDTEFPFLSTANVSGLKLEFLEGYSQDIVNAAFMRTKNAAYEIISKKGATYYAIGVVISRICRSILEDQHEVMPVSTWIDNYYDVCGLCLSTPCVIGRNGIERKIQLPLNESEIAALRHSGSVLKEILDHI
ncbi:MAG: L-lactate dehydrogenase [Candidatus Woesearchaeota archaeon]